MKTIRTTRAIATLLALGTLSVGNINVWAIPAAITINDTGDEAYWGAEDNGYGDVIGAASVFGIKQADVEYNHAAGSLKVDILTSFANSVGTNSALTAVFGDLFLNASWTPSGTAGDNWRTDNATSNPSTEWLYALGMDNHGSTGTGAVTLYELAAGNLGAMKSDDFFTSGYRNGQVVQVDTRINNPNTKTSTVGTWTAGVDKLSFDISGLVGTSLWNEVSSSKKLAIHWGMTCANDVVSGVIDVDVETGEGPSVNVPEPGILALLCSGLGGLVWSRRRKLAK